MKCAKCGSEIAEGSRFCPNCGNQTESAQQSIMQEAASKEKKGEKSKARKVLDIIGNIIAGILGLIAAIVGIGALTGAFDKNPVPCIILLVIMGLFDWLGNKFSKVPMLVFDGIEIVLMIILLTIASSFGTIASVKGASPEGYPGITYEEAFEDYFSNPTWKKLGKNEDGNVVVKFTGNCLYMDQTALAEIKFTIYKDQGLFVVSSVEINDQDMGIFGNALVMDVFEEYSESHSSKKTNDVSEINNIENRVADNNTVLPDNSEPEKTYNEDYSSESSTNTTIEDTYQEEYGQELSEIGLESSYEDVITKFGYMAGQYDDYDFIRDLLEAIDQHTECHSMDDIRNYLIDRGWYTESEINRLYDEIICHKFMWCYRADGLPGYIPQWFDSNGNLIGGVAIDFVEVAAPDGYVNLREGAGTQYDIVTPIYNGTILRVYAKSGDGNWFNVTMEDCEGWVAASQVSYL